MLHRLVEPGQYTSYDFAKACRAANVSQSMGTVGDCFDNVMAEIFFATMECEPLDRSTFEIRNQARMAIFDFIEGSTIRSEVTRPSDTSVPLISNVAAALRVVQCMLLDERHDVSAKQWSLQIRRDLGYRPLFLGAKATTSRQNCSGNAWASFAGSQPLNSGKVRSQPNLGRAQLLRHMEGFDT